MQEIMTLQDWKNVIELKLGKNQKICKDFIMSFSDSSETEFQEIDGQPVLDITPGVNFPKLERRMDDFFLKKIHQAFYKKQRKTGDPSLKNKYILKALIHFKEYPEKGLPKDLILTAEEEKFLSERIKKYQDLV